MSCIANRIVNEHVSQGTPLQSIDELDYNLSFDSISDEQEYRQRLSLEFKRRLSEGDPVNPLLKLSQEELAKLKQLYDYEIAYEDYDSDNYDTDDSVADINEDNEDQEGEDEGEGDNNADDQEEETMFELEV